MTMKRFCIILTLICLMPVCADAQWYLFPGNKKKQKNIKEEKKEVPVAVKDSVAADTLALAQDSVIVEELFVFDRPSVMQLAMILPLQAGSAKPSSSFLEMYSGALLAIRDLGNTGLKANLRLIDSSGKDLSASQGLISNCDVIIGPVAYNEIVAMLPQCSGQQMLVSPLEPRSAALADSCNVIQAPSGWTRQIDDMIDWLEEDLQIGDEVVVLKEEGSTAMGEQSMRIMNTLEQKHIRYRTAASLESIGLEDGLTYRILIASDNDAFITRSIRSIGIAAELKKQIVLYTSSRVRNCVDANVADLYNANTHMTAAYHIDYNDPAVEAFILAYRSVFKAEPSSFAFQGYDTMRYFASMCDEYGRWWHKKLPEKSERGLQSDFKFSKDEGKGRINIAVRRVIYNKDLSTTLL